MWEPPSHLGYVILSGMPVRNYRADIHLNEETGADGSDVTTVIEWSASFDPKIPGTGALLRTGLGAIIGRFAKRAAVRSEEPSVAAPGLRCSRAPVSSAALALVVALAVGGPGHWRNHALGDRGHARAGRIPS